MRNLKRVIVRESMTEVLFYKLGCGEAGYCIDYHAFERNNYIKPNQ